MAETLLELREISKSFGGVKALDRVSLTLKKGEIHCLAGENGSGKSTLIKIISGFYKSDHGAITFDGKTNKNLSISESIHMGIQVIYQDLSIFPNLTVMENISMNYELFNRKKIVNWKMKKRIAKESLEHIGISIPLNEPVENLSVADKQLVAIARSILYRVRLIIMDEPTSALTRNEVDKLFRVIRQLQSEGITILFVSHKLDEVFEISDRFTVLRNGKIIVTDSTANIDNDKFIYYMTGRQIREEYFSAGNRTRDTCLFKVENLSLTNAFKDVSFEIYPGEILGITGLLGSGRTELAKALFGLYKAGAGKIYVDNIPARIGSPRDAVKHGIAYVPEDRLTEGLFLNQSVRDNLAISSIDNLTERWGRVNKARLEKSTDSWVAKLSIKLNKTSDPISTLSGGNQQKAVLGKWLETKPRVLVLNGPTVGVDIGSKFDIHALLRSLAAEKKLAIILISDDIAEVLKNCNRILIINRGRIVNERINTDLDEKQLTALIMNRQEKTG
ncbi:MAG: sugar ABC transporter ATP-binding protein [Spirochaetaceae bacterium]|jgi:simple sugar transport system ATP-binding protein|nr:sugar ABC transporter ATP-binding protein [Spirochaetaceae bacterium]